MCRRKCDNIFFWYIVESGKLLVKRKQMAFKVKSTYVYFFIIIRYSSVFVLTDVYGSVFIMETTFSSKWRSKPSSASTNLLHYKIQIFAYTYYSSAIWGKIMNFSHKICSIDTYFIMNETHNFILTCNFIIKKAFLSHCRVKGITMLWQQNVSFSYIY